MQQRVLKGRKESTIKRLGDFVCNLSLSNGGLQTFAALVPFLCGNNFIDSGCWSVPAWISQRHWMIAGYHHRFGKRESDPFAGNSTT
jgi:hypothetical protein